MDFFPTVIPQVSTGAKLQSNIGAATEIQTTCKYKCILSSIQTINVLNLPLSCNKQDGK